MVEFISPTKMFTKKALMTFSSIHHEDIETLKHPKREISPT